MTINLPLVRAVPLQNAESEEPLVIIVDDDAAVREALSELMASAGFEVVCHASTLAFLDAGAPDRPCCLIVDVRMPGASGLDLQETLSRSSDPRPIIFLTGYGDIPMTVQAMKAGAIDFLTKPVRDQTLLDAVHTAIAKDRVQRHKRAEIKRHLERLATLTAREREVLQKVVCGRLNKQIAFDLGISEVTVKLHRSNAMRKMATASMGQLIRIWETLPEIARR
ncbi:MULTISPECIES: response regulator transcription factor [unclassified Bradyrhizobium]|uniref:response regulator transcription factor n=1 Tax=unclassified Bradyrhizobium TaxID=2631580 RepID=UPI00339402DB